MKNWMEKHSIGITFALVVAVMVMIFCFSAQTGEQSGALSGGITAWIVGCFVPDFENLPVSEQEQLCNALGLVVRKMGHFLEYALLGLTLMLHIRQVGKRITVPQPWLWSWAVGTLYAASDEFHQGFVAGRGPSVTDVMLDSFGVIAGTALLLLILWRREASQNQKSL